MKMRMMAAAAATVTLLAACSRAPETAPAADAATPATTDEHAGHTTAAVPRKPAPAGATVSIASPKDGETVTSPVKVVFAISGMSLAPAGEDTPNTGHHHLLVDADLADPNVTIPTDANHLHFGKAQTEAAVELTPGTHTLQLVLGDFVHIPFDPVIASPKITITVK